MLSFVIMRLRANINPSQAVVTPKKVIFVKKFVENFEKTNAMIISKDPNIKENFLPKMSERALTKRSTTAFMTKVIVVPSFRVSDFSHIKSYFWIQE